MFEKWYKITGFTRELMEIWSNDLRDDILYWEDEKHNVEARIKLGWFQAIRFKRSMNRNNKKQTYYKLQLIPMQRVHKGSQFFAHFTTPFTKGE